MTLRGALFVVGFSALALAGLSSLDAAADNNAISHVQPTSVAIVLSDRNLIDRN